MGQTGSYRARKITDNEIEAIKYKLIVTCKIMFEVD